MWYTALSTWSMSTQFQWTNSMWMSRMFGNVFRSGHGLWKQWHHLFVSIVDWSFLVRRKKLIDFFLLSIPFRSTCHLEYDACTRHADIKAIHMGQCNNCHNVTCPFNGQCRSEQGNYTCSCPTRDTCPPMRVSHWHDVKQSDRMTEFFKRKNLLKYLWDKISFHRGSSFPRTTRNDNESFALLFI